MPLAAAVGQRIGRQVGGVDWGAEYLGREGGRAIFKNPKARE